MSVESLAAKIDRIGEEQETQTQAIGVLGENVQRLAEMVKRLVDILTPEEKAGGGELAAALAALLQAVERQNRLLEDHTKRLDEVRSGYSGTGSSGRPGRYDGPSGGRSGSAG